MLFGSSPYGWPLDIITALTPNNKRQQNTGRRVPPVPSAFLMGEPLKAPSLLAVPSVPPVPSVKTKNKVKRLNSWRWCSPCSPGFFHGGTATGPVVTGCSPCSLCSPYKTQRQSKNQRITRYAGAVLWRVALTDRLRSATDWRTALQHYACG